MARKENSCGLAHTGSTKRVMRFENKDAALAFIDVLSPVVKGVKLMYEE